MSNDIYESFNHAGKRIEIHIDSDPESPRQWDNLGTMICFHRNYNLGDKSSFFTDAPQLKEWLDDIKPPIVIGLYLYDHSGISMQASESGNPFHCPWDSGQVGVIFAERDKLLEEFPVRPRTKAEQVFHAMAGKLPRRRLTKAIIAKAKECLLQEVKTYDEYLTGQVYGYVVKELQLDEDGDPLPDDEQDGDEEDSCWGIYGLDYCKQQAMEIAAYEAKA